MSGFMLCFDLMKTVGEKVEEKRTRDYWSEMREMRHCSSLDMSLQSVLKNQVCLVLKEMRGDLERIQEEVPDFTMLEMMAQELHYKGDSWEENHEDSEWWYDQPEFWEDESLCHESISGGITVGEKLGVE